MSNDMKETMASWRNKALNEREYPIVIPQQTGGKK
tara:strand:+ start:405 stop:509 length:105 start_codon:yes stop_codon:yes gene_type:complete